MEHVRARHRHFDACRPIRCTHGTGFVFSVGWDPEFLHIRPSTHRALSIVKISTSRRRCFTLLMNTPITSLSACSHAAWPKIAGKCDDRRITLVYVSLQLFRSEPMLLEGVQPPPAAFSARATSHFGFTSEWRRLALWVLLVFFFCGLKVRVDAEMLAFRNALSLILSV